MLEIIINPENKILKDLCYEFTSSKAPKYVLGRNEFALSIAKNVDIDGFIDDYTNETSWQGKPVVPIDEVPKDAIVAIAVVGILPLTAVERVKKYKLRYIDYFTLLRYSSLKLKKLPFINGFKKDFLFNINKYKIIYNKLIGNESKKQFTNLINFRLNYDLTFMKGFKNIQDQQYFEPFITLNPEAVFVDVGGFDGFTSHSFIQKCPKYKSIYFFEPDEVNLQKAKEKLKNYSNIFYFNTALSDKNEIVSFKSSGSSSKIDSEGENKIRTQRLDDCINEYCTYIKIDVEGWEAKVIQGSKTLIKKYKPQLAICVYHRCDDLWRIPEKVLSIRDDYKLYLRHYTEGITETVMYFV